MINKVLPNCCPGACLHGFDDCPLAPDADSCALDHVGEVVDSCLLTDNDKTMMKANKLSFHKVTTGKYFTDQENIVKYLFDNWNQRLGYRRFGY
jgi:hypothetical protein